MERLSDRLVGMVLFLEIVVAAATVVLALATFFMAKSSSAMAAAASRRRLVCFGTRGPNDPFHPGVGAD